MTVEIHTRTLYIVAEKHPTTSCDVKGSRRVHIMTNSGRNQLEQEGLNQHWQGSPNDKRRWSHRGLAGYDVGETPSHTALHAQPRQQETKRDIFFLEWFLNRSCGEGGSEGGLAFTNDILFSMQAINVQQHHSTTRRRKYTASRPHGTIFPSPLEGHASVTECA